MVGRAILAALVLASGCSKKQGTEEKGQAPTVAAPSVTGKSQASPATPKPADDDVCGWLSEEDFKSAGLAQGKAKRESGLAGPGCTWDPVLGSGGFLHVEITSMNAYEKRKERDPKPEAVTGIGDEAYVVKMLSGQALYVKKGSKAARIDGNAKLDRAKLEPLGRAVARQL